MDAKTAWKKFVEDNSTSICEMKFCEIFQAGYDCRNQEVWEDGYKHGWDEGRYWSIENFPKFGGIKDE
jgi:hypothetical protein